MDVTESGCMMAGLQFDGLVTMLKHFVETPIPPQDGVDTEPLMLAEAVSRDEETREEMLADRQAEVTAARAASRRVYYLVTGKQHKPPNQKKTNKREMCNAVSCGLSAYTRRQHAVAAAAQRSVPSARFRTQQATTSRRHCAASPADRNPNVDV